MRKKCEIWIFCLKIFLMVWRHFLPNPLPPYASDILFEYPLIRMWIHFRNSALSALHHVFGENLIIEWNVWVLSALSIYILIRNGSLPCIPSRVHFLPIFTNALCFIPPAWPVQKCFPLVKEKSQIDQKCSVRPSLQWELFKIVLWASVWNAGREKPVLLHYFHIRTSKFRPRLFLIFLRFEPLCS